VKRTPVNPWSWSLNFGYNQAEVVEGANRQLICAGQTCGLGNVGVYSGNLVEVVKLDQVS